MKGDASKIVTRSTQRQSLNPTEVESAEKLSDVQREQFKAKQVQDIEDKAGQLNEENEEDVCDSDEDDAPESVSWSASKEMAVLERRKEKETTTAAKLKEKQLRKEKDERLKWQKSRKERQHSRLPNDVLQMVAKRKEAVTKQLEVPVQHITFDSDSEEEVLQMREDEEENDDSRGIQVVVLNKGNKKPKQVLDSASEFLQKHLYGNRLNRVDTVRDLSLKRKGKSVGPAIKFSKTIK